LKALSESITSIQGGCVGKDGYDEILASTYSGKLDFIYSIKVAYGGVIKMKQALLLVQLTSLNILVLTGTGIKFW